jgi:hypothetical protein
MEADSDELDEFKVKSDYEEEKTSRESSLDKSYKYRAQATLEAD